MLILNNRETKRDGEVRYTMTRQVKRGSKELLQLSYTFPAAMRLPNALRGDSERHVAAKALLRMRRKMADALFISRTVV